MKSAPLRAAVVGGSGFGRYHAQWYAREGAEVVAYTCTSDESVESAEGSMMDLTGQSPRGYSDPALMALSERPQLVSICTPPATHLDLSRRMLEAGAHVLCEKPLHLDPEKTTRRQLEDVDELLAIARDADRILAVNLQYAALLEPYLQLYERRRGAAGPVDAYEFEMESKGNRHGVNRHHKLWIELGPHALTPLLALLPGARIDEASLRTRMSETEVTAKMILVAEDGRRVEARLRTASCAKDAVPIRRIGVNGFAVDIISEKDADDRFQTRLHPVDGGEDLVTDDLMRVSVRSFVRAARGDGAPLVDGAAGRRNLEALLAILETLEE